MSASGHKLQLYGQQAVHMKLLDGRKVWITFQVCDVSVPIMSVGNFCAKGDDRYATIHHEWWFSMARRSRRNVSTTVQIVDPSGSTGDAAGHHVAVPQLTDDEFPMRPVLPGSICTPRGDEEYNELETLSVASLPGRRVPSKYKIETHNLLHDPAMPWYDICIQSKSRDDFHRRAGPKVPLVIHFNYAGRRHAARTTKLGFHGRNRHEQMALLGHQPFESEATRTRTLYHRSSHGCRGSDIQKVIIQSDGESAS